ncbi:hypothetical protein MmiEs2_02620 [Methanimicrococcus stummii]|uniref:Uncharacterized protein n=1 Tax=Methanimicrococcus stummii TaxID=3028294 RepID=A0AA96VGR0_9EURY|nr:hypothetical protein [Methanimicrococcus sp. Es2]WNY28081.1 hypothetical protein MmiEs2_02620 [Methanimicrococcus sp. Es2]
MDLTDNNQILTLIQYQKQNLAIENFKYYQTILEDYYVPSNKLLKQVRKDLNEFRAELKKDYELDSKFRHVSVLKYHEGLAKIVDEFIVKGQKLNNDHPYVGKEFNKDSIVVVISLESIKNLLTEQVFITHIDTGDVLKGFEKADAALLRLIELSESVITNIVRSLVTINSDLKRDFSNYCL